MIRKKKRINGFRHFLFPRKNTVQIRKEKKILDLFFYCVDSHEKISVQFNVKISYILLLCSELGRPFHCVVKMI